MRLRTAFLIAGAMLALIILAFTVPQTSSSSSSVPVSYSYPRHVLPGLRDVTFTARVVSHYRMVNEDNVIAAYAAQVAYQQAQQELAAQRAREATAVAASAAIPSAPTSSSYADSAGIPAAWWPTALCEEGGRDDPYAGYFGILEWMHFDGYPTAGSAPLSVQLAWEYTYQHYPPDAPGQCHSY